MKKFDIHDWQAKQTKKRLTEEDEWQKRQDRMTPGKNPEYFYDKDSLIGKLKKDPDFIKKLNAKSKEDKAEKDDEKLANVKGDIDTMGEHHGDDFPEGLLKKSVNDFLEDLKKKSEKDYDAVEDIMRKYFGKEMDEMNSLESAGAGASFDAGKGMGYMPKKAFGGNKNKKEVLGYKKVKDLNEQNSPKWWKKIK
tara:strand:- start:1164 stop:1745 length:582 start_codon:yes stop_codon:yes gene_type:complete